MPRREGSPKNDNARDRRAVRWHACNLESDSPLNVEDLKRIRQNVTVPPKRVARSTGQQSDTEAAHGLG